MLAVAGVVIILVAIYAVIRKVDVRLALTVAALALGCLAGQPQVIVREFLATFSNERFVVPICSAMGFAYVLRHTGCDQHLVQLLAKPVRRIRFILVPGTVLIGFFVNVPIISQTSTAVTIGPVLVPLLRTARLHPATIGAALLLGTSLGGELLNPGAPELQTVSRSLQIQATECVAHVAPLLFVHLTLVTLVFWLQSCWTDDRTPEDEIDAKTREAKEMFRVNYFKAFVPLVPLALLFLTSPPLQLVSIEHSWLVDENTPADDKRFDSRLIGAAMLVGVLIASLASGEKGRRHGPRFFEGAGYAFTHIIGLIVSANCLGVGVKSIGLDKYLGAAIGRVPHLLSLAALAVPLGFAVLCGSGYASTQSLYEFFVAPSRAANIDPASVGALVSLGAAAGRTMSPVAAVVLMCAALSGAEPLALVKRVIGPLLAGLSVVLLVRMLGIL